MITAIIIVVCVLLVLGLAAAASAVRVLREYERGVMFRLGRLMELRGPGLVMLIPSIDRLVRVSLRTVTLRVPPQEIITRDNVPARVTAVAYYRVIDPSRAVIEVEDYEAATLQIAQTTLRSVLGEAELDSLLSDREHLNDSLQQVIDTQTEPWGIKVTVVEIRDVEIPERMQHAIARQAEAERERRAKIINAEGEFQAAARLRDAAEVMGDNSVTLQLRYLQTLREIGGNQNSTIVFPMPIDIVRPMIDALGSAEAGAAAQRLTDQARAEAEQIESPEQLELGPGAVGVDSGALGGDRDVERVPLGGDRDEERVPLGGDRDEERVPLGGDRDEEGVPLGGDRDVERLPTGGDENADRVVPGGGDRAPDRVGPGGDRAPDRVGPGGDQAPDRVAPGGEPAAKSTD